MMSNSVFGGYQTLNMPRPRTGGMLKRSTPSIPIVDFRLVGRTSVFPEKPSRAPRQKPKIPESTTPSYKKLVKGIERKAPLVARVAQFLDNVEDMTGQKSLKGLARNLLKNKLEIIAAMRIVCPELAISEISAHLGCCSTSVYGAFKQYGLPTSNKK